MFLYGNEMGKSLQRVYGSSLHSEDGTARVLNELLQDGLSIVVFAVGETSEGTHTNEVAVAAHNGDSLEQVF